MLTFDLFSSKNYHDNMKGNDIRCHDDHLVKVKIKNDRGSKNYPVLSSIHCLF